MVVVSRPFSLSVASDIVALRCAVAVAKFGDVTTAAAAVGLSRAGLVSRLRRLENKLTAPLFTPGSRFTDVTPEGLAFLTAAGSLLDQLEDLLTAKDANREAVTSAESPDVVWL